MSWNMAILAVLVAACAPRASLPTEGVAPQVSTIPAATSPALAPVASLAGEWRVAGLDGAEIAGPVGIALRADSRDVWWEPRCAGYVRSYSIEGTRFATGPHIGFKPPRPGELPPPVCLIAPPPQMGAIFDALTAAIIISRTPNNGVELRGGGHSLLLFSQ